MPVSWLSAEDNFKGSYTLKINERFCKRSYQCKIQKMLFLGFQYMRRILLYAFLLFFLLPSCSNRNNTKVVKPKYHHRLYDRKKDKRTKRTKAYEGAKLIAKTQILATRQDSKAQWFN